MKCKLPWVRIPPSPINLILEKLFPQYFAMNVESFYADPEIETIKKLLLDLEIKMNIFDHKQNVQACF